MRFFIIFIFVALLHCDETTESSQSTQEINEADYEFPQYEDTSLLNTIISRFSIYKENYILPVYYHTNGIEKPYKPIEIKLQISMKMLVSRDLFAGVGLYLAYTQKSFFQAYSMDISSPFRFSDFIPEVMFYKPIDWKFAGGEFYNIRFGYRHRSNGEGFDKGKIGDYSQGTNMIMAELMYKKDNFYATLSVYAPFLYSNSKLHKYLGYSDLELGYTLADKHQFKAIFTNLVHNYLHYRGSVQLEYRFEFDYAALYIQYFYGYGDNIYQYNKKTNAIGVGVAIPRF